MIFKVFKGNHKFSPRLIRFFFGNKVKRKVLFTNNCLYNINESQLNINKLFGFSLLYHHWESARFGWRAMDGKIELLAYIYNNRKRINEWDYDILLARVDIDTLYNLSLEIKNNNYQFKIFDEFGQLISIREYPCKSNMKFGYLLNPYFGGKVSAPHDMEIQMTE
jgi:hypothetical protein